MNPTKTPKELITGIDRFNAKERFYVVRAALGDGARRLSPEFVRNLSQVTGLDIPDDCRYWIDYHFEWLYALKVMSTDGLGLRAVRSNTEGTLTKRSNIDIDLMLAYAEGESLRIIALEAKGFMSHSNPQMNDKMRWYRLLFGNDGNDWERVRPTFVLLAPNAPQRLQHKQWPAWTVTGGKPPFMRLSVPDSIITPERCGADGRRDEHGGHWHLIPRRGKLVE